MFLDEILFEKVKSTRLTTKSEIIDLIYDLYEIAVKHSGGEFSGDREKIHVSFKPTNFKQAVNGWNLFVRKVQVINPPLADILRKHSLESFVNNSKAMNRAMHRKSMV